MTRTIGPPLPGLGEKARVPTRDQIRSVALALFAERGYHGTSMREIADAVGVRPASLYHHFTSKEDLLWDLTWSALDELERTRRLAAVGLQDGSPSDQLAAFVESHVSFHARFSQQATLVNLNFSTLRPERYRRAIEARAAYADRLRDILARGRQAGEMRFNSLRVTTFAVLQMCTGVSVWYRPDGELSIESLCADYRGLVLTLVGSSRTAIDIGSLATPAPDSSDVTAGHLH